MFQTLAWNGGLCVMPGTPKKNGGLKARPPNWVAKGGDVWLLDHGHHIDKRR